MATWVLRVLLLVLIVGSIRTSAQTQPETFYQYAGGLNTPVCYAPLEVVIITSDYNGLKNNDTAYRTFFSNIMTSLELRQQGSVRVVVILTSSVFPSQREVGYSLELSGTDEVTVTRILDNNQVTLLPSLLQKIRTEIASNGPSKKLVLFLTDEVNELDIDGTMRETRIMRDQGYIFAGITNLNSRRILGALQEITGSPNNVFSYSSAEQMAKNVSAIFRVLCPGSTAEPLTTPTPAPTVAAITAAPTRAVNAAPITPTLGSADATSAPAIISSDPRVTVKPSFGPEAGGTVITMTGQILQQEFQLISISTVPCSLLRRYGQTIECVTSTRPSAVPANRPLEIVLVPTSGNSITVPDAFMYMSNTATDSVIRPTDRVRPVRNPVVSDISPQYTIVSGGILMTVYGNNFDLVNLAELTLNVKREGNIERTFSERCIGNTDTEIYCSTPIIDIPEVTSLIRFKRGLNSRNRRQAQGLGLINNVDLDFTIGVRLDSITRYSDYKPLNVFVDPYIYPFENSPHTHKSSNILEIKGANLTLALGIGDYSVFIGDTNCAVVQLFSNRITCKQEGKPTSFSRDKNGHFDVQVSIGVGNLIYSVGKLEYGSSSASKYFWPIVAAVLGGAGLIFAVIAIIIIKRCVRDRSVVRRT